jgi:rhamnosyltransferase
LKYPVSFHEIKPDSFSHGGTRNLAASLAKGRVLVYLTQDAVPGDEHWLKKLVENFNTPNVAGVFGRQLPNDDSSGIEKFYLSYLYPEQTIIKNSLNFKDCLLKDIFFSNVNSAILKSEWEKYKFDENLIMSEDQEWSKKMLASGKYIIYEPGARVFHSHKYSLLELMKRNFDSGLSLKQIICAPFSRSLRYEMNYLKEGYRYFLKHRSYLSLVLFPFYEFARLLSFSIGLHSNYLPLTLKKLISQNKNYWLNK